MTTRAAHPVAQGLLGWMQANPARLRGLLDEEAAGAAPQDLGPAGDPSIRAHLRFVAEALAANAAGPSRDALGAFSAGLADALAEREDRVDDEIRRVGEAHAFEAEVQFGEGAGEDPSMRDTLDRRVRVGGWTRVFLAALDEARAPAPAVALAALGWMARHQGLLADTIFAMDRAAKRRLRDREGPDAIADADVVNRIGQASMIQAHTRFLVEALAEVL
ncbi:MAG: hypothetical protein AB7V42_07055 [Thermoleophilia bacterium]